MKKVALNKTVKKMSVGDRSFGAKDEKEGIEYNEGFVGIKKAEVKR